MARVYVIQLSEIKKLPPAFAAAHFPRRFYENARFRFEADRLRSTGAGALLWYRFGDVEKQLQSGAYGKPYIKDCAQQFNLSHSGKYVVLAVGEGCIGVDIEKCTEKNLVAAKRVYTPAELEWMQAEPLSRFETLWTVKESVMKAVGKGFQLEPSSFEVLGMLNGEALAIDGVKLYCFTKRYRGYTISLCREKPIQSLIIKEISEEEILNREKNA